MILRRLGWTHKSLSEIELEYCFSFLIALEPGSVLRLLGSLGSLRGFSGSRPVTPMNSQKSMRTRPLGARWNRETPKALLAKEKKHEVRKIHCFED